MPTEMQTQARRRDRWVDRIVIVMVVLGLILGWVVKSGAEGRTVDFSADGLQGRYPQGWMKADAQSPVLLEVQDLTASGYRTTLSVQRRPLPQGIDNPLAAMQQMLQMDRGGAWMGYRSLQVDDQASIGGRTGTRITFAYVETNPNPFLQSAPVVMRGEDWLFVQGDKVLIVTLTAAESNYAQAQQYLQDLVRSLQ